jgi:hypothetical protein
MTHDELQDQILGFIKDRPRTFFSIENRFRIQASPLCKHGRYGPSDVRPDLMIHRMLQKLRKAGHIRFVDHAWRLAK